MKKTRLVSLFLVLAMLASIVPAFAYTKGSLLPQVKTYRAAFTDTKGTWCDKNVQTVYEVGLMDGKSTTKFDPKGSLTCAQIIVITARLHELLNGGDGKFDAPGKNEDWYQPYLDYLDKLSEANPDLMDALGYVSYTADDPCDRYDFVWLLSAVLPDSALKAINSITVLPDTYGDEDVLAFYNAGILTGINEYGTFCGTCNLNRGQAAAMLARIVDASQRMKFTPKVFSYAKALLGVDAKTPVLTIDGWTVSAEVYAYCLSSAISSYEFSAQYEYYDTYAQYWDAYYENDNYDSFAEYLLGVYGIDVSKECTVKWNVADKAGLTPPEKVRSDTLDTLKQIAELFVHQSGYPLTAAQKSEIATELTHYRSLFFGFSDAFVEFFLQGNTLTDNMSAKYAPSKSQLNDYLAEYGYFYGQCISVSYDLGSEDYYGVTKQEALQQINAARSAASGHTNEPDYFEYLNYKYGGYGEYTNSSPSLISIDGLSGADRTALKNLAVGSLSNVICVENTSAGYGEYCLFLKSDPSTDEGTMSSLGSVPAMVKLDAWAQDANVVTTSVYSGFSVPALAAKYDTLAVAGLTSGI